MTFKFIICAESSLSNETSYFCISAMNLATIFYSLISFNQDIPKFKSTFAVLIDHAIFEMKMITNKTFSNKTVSYKYLQCFPMTIMNLPLWIDINQESTATA